MNKRKLRKILVEKGLKVTPRRLLILEAVFKLNNHPSAEEIIRYIRKYNPKIATATVYKALNVLLERNLINKVNTEKHVVRYDALLENHHHLYCSDSGRIVDYKDKELDDIISKHFEGKGIPGFKAEDIRLQIIGRMIKENR